LSVVGSEPALRRADLRDSALDQASAAWWRLAWWQHALAISAILVAVLVRFYPAVSSAEPLGDELPQERALEVADSGRSPYVDETYPYPPSLLRLGGLLRRLPLRSPFLPLRCATILGLSALLWCSTIWLPWLPWRRACFAVVYAVLAPGVGQGVELGNLSFAIGGMVVVALLSWRRAPVTSGALLGLSLLVKPLAPAALTALFMHRPGRGRKHWLAAGAAVIIAALPLLADPELGAFLHNGSRSWVISRTASVHRFLALANAPEGNMALMMLLLLLVAVAARWWVTDQPQLVATALAGCVTVTPVVWNHTLVLTLPLQAMAVTIAWSRWRSARGDARRWRRWEATVIALAVAALTFAEGVTGIDDRSVALQLLAVVPTALSPAILAGYVLHFRATRAVGIDLFVGPAKLDPLGVCS
jgi:hypothetical protein